MWTTPGGSVPWNPSSKPRWLVNWTLVLNDI